MKTIFTLMLLISVSLMIADVTQKNYVKVKFEGFAEFENNTTDYTSGLLSRSDSKGDSRGEGMMGRMLSASMPKGITATITDLPAKMIYTLDTEKKTYTKTSMEEFRKAKEQLSGLQVDGDENVEDMPETRKIIRREMKVDETRETRKFGKWDTRKYTILFLEEAQDLQTQIISTDSMLVTLWMTADKTDFDKANQEKAAYTKAMMEMIGLTEDGDDLYNQMLGLQWLGMMAMMNPGKPTQDAKDIDYSQFRKLTGYPVVIDGALSHKEVDPTKVKKEAPKKSGFSLSGGFGGLTQSLADSAADSMTKEDKPGYKTVMTYYVETKDIQFGQVDPALFKVPATYKEQ